MDETALKRAVAALLMTDPDRIAPSTSLAALDNSLGEVKLRLALKRLSLTLPPSHRPTTFGELCALLNGGSSAAPAPVAPIPLPAPGPSVGLDCQEISALPMATDYWEDPFYQGVFEKSEIAYAVAQPEPRRHFAAFWCAKEALRKCDSRFLAVDLPAIVVGHDPGGRPYLVWKTTAGDQRLPHSVSISHSAEIAMAVVLALWPSP